MWFHSFSLSVLFLVSLVAPALAQTSNIFQWQFVDNALSTYLPTCFPLPIILKPYIATLNNTIGVPPYYMTAFAVGRTPITSFIGSDNSSLSWQVTHPVGTKLVLDVIDASGSAGGVPPSLYTVIAGSSTHCVSDASSQDFNVTSNVTDTLTTCQPWGITVKGGVPPYNLTLAALNSPFVTNVTMPLGSDVFTFIGRTDPDGQLIAAISDLTGRWATGTPIVQTQGSFDDDCIGLVSSSGNSTVIQQKADAAKAQSNKKKAIIGGVVGTLGGLLLIAVAIFAFFYLRKRKHRQVELEHDLMPRQFEETGGEILSINNFISPTPQNKSSYAGCPLAPRTSSSGALLSTNYSNNPTAQGSQGGPSDSEHATSSRRSPHSPLPQAHHDQDRPITEGVPVFQHRDAGVVRELPPPYADRGGLYPEP